MKYQWQDEYLLSFPGLEKDYKLERGWHRCMVRGRLCAAVCAPGVLAYVRGLDPKNNR